MVVEKTTRAKTFLIFYINNLKFNHTHQKYAEYIFYDCILIRDTNWKTIQQIHREYIYIFTFMAVLRIFGVGDNGFEAPKSKI